MRVAREKIIGAKPGFRVYQVLQERLKPGGVLSKQDTAWDLGIADRPPAPLPVSRFVVAVLLHSTHVLVRLGARFAPLTVISVGCKIARVYRAAMQVCAGS